MKKIKKLLSTLRTTALTLFTLPLLGMTALAADGKITADGDSSGVMVWLLVLAAVALALFAIFGMRKFRDTTGAHKPVKWLHRH